MKFTVDSKQLEKLLLTVGGALSSNPIIPIMENYKIDVLQDRVVATATDAQITITSHVLNTSLEAFSFCVGAKLLATLKNLPQQPLSLAYDYNKSTLVVKTVTGRYRLPTQDVNDFPSLQEFTGQGVDLTGEEAITIFSTHAIASSDMLRDNLRCVYLDKANTAIAATDAHKLIRIEMEKLEGLEHNMLIPKDTCKKALSLLKVNDNVNIKSTENKVCFTIGNTIISAVLIDASYPDYRAVIPNSNSITADIDKNALLRMLKRIMPYTSKSTSMVRLTFTKDTLTVTAEDLDMGNKAEESISIQYQYDNPLVIGFNSRFVIDVLGQLTSDTINVEMQNKSMPMVLKEDGSDAKTCILMPVMLHDV